MSLSSVDSIGRRVDQTNELLKEFAIGAPLATTPTKAEPNPGFGLTPDKPVSPQRFG